MAGHVIPWSQPRGRSTPRSAYRPPGRHHDHVLVIRPLGTVWSVFRSLNSSFDFVLSHNSEPPVDPPIGTAVVTRLPLEMPRILHPRPMRSCRWSPLSTVKFPGRSNNTGNSE